MSLSRFGRGKSTAKTKADPQASADHILTACNDAGVAFLAKDLIGMAPSATQFDGMMAQVQGIQDMCAAFSIDDPKAGRQLADTFMQKVFVESDWAGAVGALLTDAGAIASGEEIDHHQPPDTTAGSGAFNPTDFYQ